MAPQALKWAREAASASSSWTNSWTDGIHIGRVVSRAARAARRASLGDRRPAEATADHLHRHPDVGTGNESLPDRAVGVTRPCIAPPSGAGSRRSARSPRRPASAARSTGRGLPCPSRCWSVGLAAGAALTGRVARAVGCVGSGESRYWASQSRWRGGDGTGQSADQPLRGLTRHRYPDAGVGLIARADHQHQVIAGIVLDRPKQPVSCRHRLLSRCNFRALPRRARTSYQQ